MGLEVPLLITGRHELATTKNILIPMKITEQKVLKLLPLVCLMINRSGFASLLILEYKQI